MSSVSGTAVDTDPATSAATHLAREFLSVTINRGMDLAGIFASAGLPAGASAWLNGPLTGRQLQQIIVPVMDRLDDAAVGHLGEPMRMKGFRSVFPNLLFPCATLGQAMEQYAVFCNSLSDNMTMSLRRERRRTSFLIETRRRANADPRAVEYLTMNFCIQLWSWLAGRTLCVESAGYSAEDSGQRTQWPAIGLKETFDAGVNYLTVATDALSYPIVRKRAEIAEYVERVSEDVFEVQSHYSDISQQLGNLLRHALNSGGCLTFEQAAVTLGLSERSLRRRLSESGEGFQQIKENIQMDIAADLLGKPDLSVTEIALRLGYSDSTAFSRAFRRHSGASPRDFRRRQSGSHSSFSL